MKISFVLYLRSILKKCELAKNHLKIRSHCFLRLRISSSLVIIILLHVSLLKAVAADENEFTRKYEQTKENGRILYPSEYDNSLQNQLLELSTVEDDNKEKTTSSIKRYKIADIEFQRVETPILIAMWIFCASLAKICEYLGSSPLFHLKFRSIAIYISIASLRLPVLIIRFIRCSVQLRSIYARIWFTFSRPRPIPPSEVKQFLRDKFSHLLSTSGSYEISTWEKKNYSKLNLHLW